MPDITVMSWNIEWMNHWFPGSTTTVAAAFRGAAQRTADVIEAIDPDVLCIQEGPSAQSEMQGFLDEFLSGDWYVVRGETGGAQKPYILFRDFNGLRNAWSMDFDADAWKYPFLEYDQNEDRFRKRTKSFTRLPVEVMFETTHGTFSLMCLHIKSLFSRVAADVNSTDAARRSRAIAEGLEQRARILQEARLLREYVQNHPYASTIRSRMLLVGDLNDGPGMDYFETRFFATDLIRRLRGDIDHPDEVLSPLLQSLPATQRYTAVFYDRADRAWRNVLLDHILPSSAFLQGTPRVLASTARVAHAEYLAESNVQWGTNRNPARNDYPSDHRPVAVRIRV